jgi:hypothetical protein
MPIDGASRPFRPSPDVLIAFVLIGFCFYYLRVADPDLWWHVKAGEITATTHDVPRVDLHSFTAPGARWTDHEWATDLIFYGAYDVLGDRGLTALKTLIGLGIAGLVLMLTRVGHRRTHLLVFLLVAQIVARYALYRPQLVSYFFVALLLLLFSPREGVAVRVPSTLRLVGVFVLWANLHGGFLAGLALIAAHAGMWWLDGAFRPELRAARWPAATRLAGAFAACALATLVNPYGFRLWVTLAHELAANDLNHRYVREWSSFSPAGLDGLLVLFMLALCVAGFALRRREWSVTEVALVAGAIGLALYSVRNVPFFVLVAAAPAARSLGAYMSDPRRTWVARAASWAALGTAWSTAALMMVLVGLNPSARIRVRSVNIGGDPSGAVAFLSANRVEGNLFNPVEWGGYLLWHLPPEAKISVDGRSSMIYPLDVLRDAYRFYCGEASPDLPIRRGADFVLVGASNIVVRSMAMDPRWSVVYQDDEAIIYAGPTPAGSRLAQRSKDGALVSPPAMPTERFP